MNTRVYEGQPVQVIKCDRCGKIYKDGGADVTVETRRIMVIRKDFDICDVCTKSLEKWMEGEKNKMEKYLGVKPESKRYIDYFG